MQLKSLTTNEPSSEVLNEDGRTKVMSFRRSLTTQLLQLIVRFFFWILPTAKIESLF